MGNGGSRYDVLVVGGGIAGMESALTLGDMGYPVLMVEKEPSIGGKMVLLSKVFPTLDCASCISTPKMAATSHHPNITLMTSAELDEIMSLADRIAVMYKGQIIATLGADRASREELGLLMAGVVEEDEHAVA